MRTYEENELRRLFDEHEELREKTREWMRESDSDSVYEQMDDLREYIKFEVDAWDNVYAQPAKHANHCGYMADAIRCSIYSYPSCIEDALCKLERYEQGVERLGGSIWDMPAHFEEAVEKVEQEICDVYAKIFKDDLEWWMDADDDEVFEQFENYFEFNADWWMSEFPEVFEDEDEDEEELVLGKCPKCGDVYNVECCHETVNGNELLVWSECGNCGHQFIEVFKLARVEEWKDRR